MLIFNPFSSQLVIYRRFVITPPDVWYWRKRHPPASVWNDLGSHKPVRGGKVGVMVKVMVMVRVWVSVIYHRDRVIFGVNGRCRLCSSLTTANGFMRTQMVPHRRGEGTFYVSIRRLGDKSSVYYQLGWERLGYCGGPPQINQCKTLNDQRILP